jgi:7,8-dihydropterin-6-yl-methyl-4-(beta-D-ribofuranosyl)aminobenzene 5'-phosphate synthase
MFCALGCGQSQPAAPPIVERGAPATSRDPASASVKLTILYDNSTTSAALKFRHGFSALVDYRGHRLLFDAGADGAALVDNMRELDIDPMTIEAVVLSHEHDDHTEGLDALLALGSKPTIYVPAQFSGFFKQQLAKRTKVVESTDAIQVMEGVHVTRPIGDDVIEQALVLDAEQGSVVVTGCAHPGIVTLVREAKTIAPRPVALLVGGFHLIGTPASELSSIVSALHSLDVTSVMPAHCSGKAAVAAFRDKYGERCESAGVGRVVSR